MSAPEKSLDPRPLLTASKQYRWEAGHFLPFVHEGHKCRRQHGHNYRMECTVAGDLDEQGFIIDFWDLDKIVGPLVELLDHRNLNDIEGLENPTAEIITGWFFDRITDRLAKQVNRPLHLIAVTVWETDDCRATISRRSR